jgi:hypothetical protein
MLAVLIWVGRLLSLEYALPKREYKSLNWPSCEVSLREILILEPFSSKA